MYTVEIENKLRLTSVTRDANNNQTSGLKANINHVTQINKVQKLNHRIQGFSEVKHQHMEKYPWAHNQ